MIGAALLASLMWGVADFLGGRASRVHPAAMVALVGQAVSLVALAAILLIAGADRQAVLPGVAVGLLGAMAILAFYRALALGTMSIVAPIVATSVIVPVLAGVLLDGERPRALQWVGIVAALTGVALASREHDAHDAVDSRKALQLAVLAAAGIGASLVFLDAAAEHDALTGVAVARAVAVPILALLAFRVATRVPWRSLPGLATIGLLDTGANLAFAVATTSGLLSLAAVLGGLFPVVTVALAYFVLHERLAAEQRAGVLLALAGIPLISA